MNDPIRAALAPFAAITEDDFKGSIFEGKPDDTEVLHFHASGKEITMGDFRRARAALAAPASLAWGNIQTLADKVTIFNATGDEPLFRAAVRELLAGVRALKGNSHE